MTAFDDILSAEKAALETVATAKEEAAAALQQAKAEQQPRIAAETADLKKAREQALSDYQTIVASKTAEIEADTQKQVVAIEKKFTAVADELTQAIVQDFVK
jgi:vacuolar-type H+-ATPase subunit H